MSETSRHYEEGESPEQLSYDDIRNELQLPGTLPHYYGQPHEIQNRLYRLGLSEQDIQLLMDNKPSGRAFNHIIRLIKNGGVERDFAIAWLERAKTGTLTSLDDTAYQVIRSEGADTVMFWTFAPHLYQALAERGIAAEQALNMIFDWSKNGASQENDWHIKGKKADATFNLKGLEFMNENHRSGYILSGNASHPSHRFTRQEAQRIADMLIAENNEK